MFYLKVWKSSRKWKTRGRNFICFSYIQGEREGRRKVIPSGKKSHFWKLKWKIFQVAKKLDVKVGLRRSEVFTYQIHWNKSLQNIAVHPLQDLLEGFNVSFFMQVTGEKVFSPVLKHRNVLSWDSWPNLQYFNGHLKTNLQNSPENFVCCVRSGALETKMEHVVCASLR